MSFARKLNDLRIAKRPSLQDVADAIGVSKAHVWNLEKGTTSNPSMELVVKLAELFRVRVADLVGEKALAPFNVRQRVYYLATEAIAGHVRHGLSSSPRRLGVESVAAPSMSASFTAGKPTEQPVLVTLADGIAVKLPGSQTVPVICDLVDEIVQVEEEDIALAIVALLEKTKMLVEGAGAVTLAAVLNKRIPGLEGKTVCLLSGGNIDVKTIAQVVERGLIAGGRYLKMTIELDDHPGALATLAESISATNANIFHITHDRRSKSLAIGRTVVSLELETRGYEHINEIVSYLKGRSYNLTVM